MMSLRAARTMLLVAAAFGASSLPATAQTGAPQPPSGQTGAAGATQIRSDSPRPSPAPVSAPDLPPDYVIGPGDVLTVSFWRRNDVSADVVVRPDGKISLLLLDDVHASGLTPEQLRDRVVDKANTFFEDARVTIVVKEVNSRIVYITGLVAKPGPYALRTRMTVVQLIAMAGGLLEFAGADRIAIMRTVNGTEKGYRFNYEEVRELKKLEQNIELKPGDTVIVP